MLYLLGKYGEISRFVQTEGLSMGSVVDPIFSNFYILTSKIEF